MEEIKHDRIIFDEIDENIFKLPIDIALAHCVAQDLRMGAGIAVEFKRCFGGVGKLIDQHLVVGNVGKVICHKRVVFYLITKEKSYGKPTMYSLSKALSSLVHKMKELKITKLGIPKIGCGLDGLDWNDVKSLITSIFYGSGIQITACIPSNIIKCKRLPLLKVYITPKNVWEMEVPSVIILFIDIEKLTNNNWTDDLIDKVNSRYPFKEKLLRDIKKKKLNPGAISYYIIENKMITCAFISQAAYYGSIEKAFKRINCLLKRYKYLVIQSGPLKITKNYKHASWLVLILRSIINKSEVLLCGDTGQTKENVVFDNYCKTLYGTSRRSSSTSYSPI